MKRNNYGLAFAAKEHLLSGNPITRLEAIVLFGVSNLTDLVSEMRKQGWVIESKSVPYARALKRVNEYAVLKTPPNLPVREITLTEYTLNE